MGGTDALTASSLSPFPTPSPRSTARDAHPGTLITTTHAAAQPVTGWTNERTPVDDLVQTAYRAWCEARKGAPLDPGEYEATRSRVELDWMTAALTAVHTKLGEGTTNQLNTQLAQACDERDFYRDAANARMGERDQLRADIAAEADGGGYAGTTELINDGWRAALRDILTKNKRPEDTPATLDELTRSSLLQDLSLLDPGDHGHTIALTADGEPDECVDDCPACAAGRIHNALATLRTTT